MKNRKVCVILLMCSIIGLLAYVQLLGTFYPKINYKHITSNKNKYFAQFKKEGNNLNLWDQELVYGTSKTIVLPSQDSPNIQDTNLPKPTTETIIKNRSESYIGTKKVSSEPVNGSNKPLFVIGILSFDEFSSRRKAVRETWLSTLLTSKSIPFQIKYKFLYDKPSNVTRAEDKVYHDAYYFNLGITGYNNKLSIKLQAWFKHALKAYPKATLIAKVDDDAFPCTPQIFHRIRNITSTRLYYGFQHWGYTKAVRAETRIDEHFLVLGRDIAAGFVDETFCTDASNYSKRACKYGDVAVGEWIHKRNISVECHSDLKKMVHFDRNSGIRSKINVLRKASLNYCEKNLIFHKSSETLMYRFHHFNKHYNGDTSKYIEEDTIKEEPMIGDIPQKVIRMLVPQRIHCFHCIIIIADAKLKSVNGISEFATSNSWCIIIVADQHIPNEDEYLNKTLGLKRGNKIYFLSRQIQEKLYPVLSERLYWNHYGRRNIGYVHAVHLGARYILDIYNTSVNWKELLLSSMKTRDIERKNGVYPHYTPCSFQNSSRYFNIDLLSYYMFNMEFTTTLCASTKSRVQFGGLHFVPVSNSSVDGASKEKAVPFVRTKITNETFYATATLWSSAAFKYLALPITVGFTKSVIVRNLLLGEYFRMSKLSNVFIPHWVEPISHPRFIADSKTGLKIEWLDLLTNPSQIAQSFQNNTLILNSDVYKVYKDLYQNGHIGYDDLVFSKAWVATISAIASLPKTKNRH